MKKRFEDGFTLVELLVLVAVIGILAAIVLVALNSARVRARDARRQSDLTSIQSALELYNDANNGYPEHDCNANTVALPDASGDACSITFTQMLGDLTAEGLLESGGIIDPSDTSGTNSSEDDNDFWFGYDVGSNNQAFQLSYWSEVEQKRIFAP